MSTKNFYKKYCPNVFVMATTEEYNKGDIATITTKRGAEHEVTVFNHVGAFTKDGIKYNQYSIQRTDGFNYTEWCKRRAERTNNWALSAQKKSDAYYKASKKDHAFLSLGEPIKVGHHSERRHRKAFEDANRNMSKSMELLDKANAHVDKAEYWEKRAEEINLSMPDSIDYYKHKLEQATELHQYYKDNKDKRPHGYSLTYANKDKKEMAKKYETAKILWG